MPTGHESGIGISQVDPAPVAQLGQLSLGGANPFGQGLGAGQVLGQAGWWWRIIGGILRFEIGNRLLGSLQQALQASAGIAAITGCIPETLVPSTAATARSTNCIRTARRTVSVSR
jgi:hypothetical protein